MIIRALFWFIFSLLFALIEVENEGKYGWAQKSQTWYRSSWHLPRVIRIFLGSKPLTGYHLFLFPLVFLLNHVPFFAGLPWSLEQEFIALAIFFSWAPLWDYLWFVFNPFYKIQEFKKVWWYAKSYCIFNLIPIENFIQWVLSVFLALAATLLTKNASLLTNHMLFLGYLILFTILSYFFLAPLYKRWYYRMRQSDDRHELKLDQPSGN